MELTVPEIGLYIKKELGYPVVNVELMDEHIIQSIDDALRIFNNWTSSVELRVAYNQQDAVVLDLGSEVRGVLEVKMLYPETQRAGTAVDPDEESAGQPIVGSSTLSDRVNIFEMMYRMVFPKFPISDWYMYRSFYEMFQKVRGTDPDWKYDKFNHKLYVDCWTGPYDIYYVVASDLTLESLSSGESQYTQMFLDLVCARAKLILSRIRGKFGNSIPAPDGQISTDADILRQEGIEKEKEVVDRLRGKAKFSCVGIIG